MKYTYCVIDFETYSYAPLETVGSEKYSLDPTTGIISVSFVFLDDSKEMVSPIYSFTPFRKGDMSKAAKLLSKFKGIIVSHRYQFEEAIFRNVWKDTKLSHFRKSENYLCTMALSYRYAYPGALDKVARAMGTTNQKLKAEGDDLIKKFSVPKNGALATPSPEDIKNFIVYGEQDVRTEVEVFQRLGDFDEFEEAFYRLDQHMNRRGIRLDIPVAKKLQKAYEQIKEESYERAKSLAGIEKSGTLTISSPPGFHRWLANLGYPVENIQKPTLEKLEAQKIPAKVREALTLRKILAAKAPTKLATILSHEVGGIVHDYLQYYGAHTGRQAGRAFQPHNLRRDAVDAKEFAPSVKRALDSATPLLERVELIGKLLRGLVIPRKGNSFLWGDYSAIEPRVLFWWAGSKTGLDAWRTGKDLYVDLATMAKIPNTFTPEERRGMGKVGILSLGYGSSEEAFGVKFYEQTGIQSVELVRKVRNAYHQKYPEVRSLWYETEDAFKRAILSKKSQTIRGKVTVKPIKSGIKVILPSGRALYYREMGIAKDGSLYYTKPLGGVVRTWGSSLVENIVQAIARDVMVSGMIQIDELKDVFVVLAVHDEILAEAKKTVARSRLKDFTRIMNTSPSWAPDLPIASKPKITVRYGKG